MRKLLLIVAVLLVTIVSLAFVYGAKGWYDANANAEPLKARAQALIGSDRGANSLTPERLAVLLKVQDPGFYAHSGIDLTTNGAGLTTLTQSLSKRLAFEEFKPGIQKIRQSGYAIGLDSILSKDEQIALFLDTVGMGNSQDGWVIGFHKASQAFFNAGPNDITIEQFYALVAVLIAPSRLKLNAPDQVLQERIQRIERLAENICQPNAFDDVWLEGCA